MTIIGRTVAPLLVLACAACALSQDPLSPPEIGTVSSAPPAASTIPSATPRSAAAPSGAPTAKPPNEPAPAMLPRGGREVFPRYRLVGYAGVTGAPTLGRLGTGPLDSRVKLVSPLQLRFWLVEKLMKSSNEIFVESFAVRN